MQKNYFTYLYIDPKKNIPIYVGKGCDNRAGVHLKKSHNTRLNRLIKRRAEQGFEMQPIVQVEVDEQTALEMEKFWIAFFGRADMREGTLLNKTDGGEGLSRVSDETKERMAAAKRGKTSPMKGKPLSAERLAAVRASNARRKKPVVIRLREEKWPGTTIRTPDGTFRTMTEAAKFYGITREGIKKRLARLDDWSVVN